MAFIRVIFTLEPLALIEATTQHARVSGTSIKERQVTTCLVRSFRMGRLLPLAILALVCMSCAEPVTQPDLSRRDSGPDEVTPPANLPPQTDRTTTPQRPHTTCPSAMAGSC